MAKLNDYMTLPYVYKILKGAIVVTATAVIFYFTVVGEIKDSVSTLDEKVDKYITSDTLTRNFTVEKYETEQKNIKADVRAVSDTVSVMRDDIRDIKNTTNNQNARQERMEAKIDKILEKI